MATKVQGLHVLEGALQMKHSVIVKNGYYDVEDVLRGGKTIVRVDEDGVEIMGYTPGYTQEQVFGPGSMFKVLRGPYQI